MSYYAGRVAVITGAGSGIGRALALGLARRGAHLALSDRDGEAADDTARQCRRAGGQARADMIDVTDRRAVLDHAAGVSGDFGRVDMAFCVAGIIHTGSLLASEFSDIELVINTNLVGVINTAKAYLPHVIASGDGHIVTVSSGFGLVGIPHYSAYCATKFAVRGFSESLRQEMELDGHPVAVTCVVPGGDPHADHEPRTFRRRGGRRSRDGDVRHEGRADGGRQGGGHHLAGRGPAPAAGARRRRRPCCFAHCPGSGKQLPGNCPLAWAEDAAGAAGALICPGKSCLGG